MAPALWVALPTTSVWLSDSTDLSPALLGKGCGAAALHSRAERAWCAAHELWKAWPGGERGEWLGGDSLWGRAVGPLQHLGGTGGTQL